LLCNLLIQDADSASFENQSLHDFCPCEVLQRPDGNWDHKRRRFSTFSDNTRLHLISGETVNHHFVDQSTQQRLFVSLTDSPLSPHTGQMLSNGSKGRLQLRTESQQGWCSDGACRLSLFCVLEVGLSLFPPFF
jgi:hypothetical protein